ncbi:MAG: GNAT family N-acetyltransferase [Geminicoccaceae bacterium]
MPIERYLPAPSDLTCELHTQLVKAGQALSDGEMKTFLLARKAEDGGALEAGCKGEIAFRSAHISELWVADSLRGQGVGSELLAEAEALARAQGCTRIHLETRSEHAKRLYEKRGYTVFGELPNYDGDISFYYLVKTLS